MTLWLFNHWTTICFFVLFICFVVIPAIYFVGDIISDHYV